MTENLLAFALTLSLLGTVTTAGAQIAPGVSPQTSSSASAASQASAPSSTEVQLLRVQLDDNRKFQEQLLGTVHWSLGTLASLAVLMVGFGWFANFRMYERDKVALQSELRGLVADEVRTASASAAKAAAEQFGAQQAAISERLAMTAKDFATTIKTQVEAVEQSSASRAATISQRLDRLKNDVLTLQLAAQIQERQSWIDRKVPRNALQASVKALRIVNEIGYDNGVAQVLDYVGKDVNLILDLKATPIDNYLVAQLVAALEAVEEPHTHAAAGLKARASALVHA